MKVAEKIVEIARTHLPPLDGVVVADLQPMRLVRSYSAGVHPHETRTHVIAFSGHPEYGDEEVLGYVTQIQGKIQAHWGYQGCDVNGVAYGSRSQANKVRQALEAAGIPHVAVMHPDAQRVLRDAGL